jgi:hypothetical protein
MIGVAGGFFAIYSALKLRTVESIKAAKNTNVVKGKKKSKKS